MTTNNESRDRIIELIAKLSKFSNPDSNAFQGEIDNAAQKIQVLMDKYSITPNELEAANATVSNREVEQEFASHGSDYKIKGVKSWHWSLAKVVARITHTKPYMTASGEGGWMRFFGVDMNSTAASALYTEWVQIIEAMAISALDDHWVYVMKKYDYSGFLRNKKRSGFEGDKFMDTVPFEERMTYFKESWLTGCMASITRAVIEQEKQRAAEMTTALVLYDEKLNDKYEEMSRQVGMRSARPTKAKDYSRLGYEQGSKAGENIKIGSKRIK